MRRARASPFDPSRPPRSPTMPAYALTIFIGAFLLFQVEPLIGKFILPWFGGSPGVWTTCLLFFQTLLLAGYAYAHLVARYLAPRRQAILHLGLLALTLAALPITPADHWKPLPGEDPVGRILALLTLTLGLPYFTLATTGPLLQHWFSQTHPGRSPYRLYALSNAASLLALLSYPFLFEPTFARLTQAYLWMAGLGLFVIGCGYCALRRYRFAAAPTAMPDGAECPADPRPPPSWLDRLLWLALSATASVLLLAITNQLCLDVAVIPFLWVLPLGLYLLSFILCFDHPRWYARWLYGPLLVVGIALVCALLFPEVKYSLPLQVAGYGLALFVGCMFCHGELFRRRPHPRYLTAFYLTLAMGGALGGLLVAVVAPLVFRSYLELPLALWVLGLLALVICLRDRSRTLAWAAAGGVLLTTLVMPSLRTPIAASLGATGTLWLANFNQFLADQWWYLCVLAVLALISFADPPRGLTRQWRQRNAWLSVALLLGFTDSLWALVQAADRPAVSTQRNFYGVLRVFEENRRDPQQHAFRLQHGGITHGMQFTDPEKAAWPTTYYGEHSGVGIALRHLPREVDRRIGLVGLGTGTLAAYGWPGDTLRFYEINPLVKDLAQSRFTYLGSSQARVEVVLGDARLSMEDELARQAPQGFDLLALDAFSSDAIPVHLLTREAFALYLQHLRPEGLLAVHISNQYLDLEPIVARLAQEFDLALATIEDAGGKDWLSPSHWVLLARDPRLLEVEEIVAARNPPKAVAATAPLWTDDYTSLWPILELR